MTHFFKHVVTRKRRDLLIIFSERKTVILSSIFSRERAWPALHTTSKQYSRKRW